MCPRGLTACTRDGPASLSELCSGPRDRVFKTYLGRAQADAAAQHLVRCLRMGPLRVGLCGCGRCARRHSCSTGLNSLTLRLIEPSCSKAVQLAAYGWVSTMLRVRLRWRRWRSVCCSCSDECSGPRPVFARPILRVLAALQAASCLRAKRSHVEPCAAPDRPREREAAHGHLALYAAVRTVPGWDAGGSGTARGPAAERAASSVLRALLHGKPRPCPYPSVSRSKPYTAPLARCAPAHECTVPLAVRRRREVLVESHVPPPITCAPPAGLRKAQQRHILGTVSANMALLQMKVGVSWAGAGVMVFVSWGATSACVQWGWSALLLLLFVTATRFTLTHSHGTHVMALGDSTVDSNQSRP